MIKEWANDIKCKTKHMNREETADYVITYYWHHILLAVLFLGFVTFTVYHVCWGGKKQAAFSFVIINQNVDFARDKEIADAFSKASGIKGSQIVVDSDYLISYGQVRLEGINESHYEKFFFNWSAKEIDAMLMPESFYRYCKTQSGTFEELDVADHTPSEHLFWDNGACSGVYIKVTSLGQYFEDNEKDPYVLVFPAEPKHPAACREFLNYALAHGISKSKNKR